MSMSGAALASGSNRQPRSCGNTESNSDGRRGASAGLGSEHRQYHVTDYIEPFSQPIAAPVAGVAHPLDRQPAEVDREEEDQQLS